MARLRELGGSPANPVERQLVARLKAELPDHCVVIPNVTLPDPSTGHGFEFDAIVISSHAVYAIEMKAWSGRITALSRADWERSGHRIEPNPLPLIDHKARVLASLIKRLDFPGVGRPPYVQACLLVSDDQAVFELLDHDERRCLRPIDIAVYLSDPTRLHQRHPAGDYTSHIERLSEHLCGSLQGRVVTKRRYGSYLADELVTRSDDSAVWLGRHAELDDGRRYRIRTWFLSAYLDASTRKARIATLRRAAEALHRVPEHPNIASLRDFGEQGAEFFEVTDWSTEGTLTTAYIRGAIHKMKPSARMTLILDLALALEVAHSHGIVHRHVEPDVILLTPDGHARLTGFERAWLEDRTTTVYGEHAAPSITYAPPELADPHDYEVFDNSDLFSLGRIALQMLLAGAPEPVRQLAEQAAQDDPAARPDNPSAFRVALERALAAALAPAPPASSVATSLSLRDARDLRSGDVIDGMNTVLGFLGRGAGTYVYRVLNETLQAELALKVFVDPGTADRAREFRLLQRLATDRVPRVHWMGRLPGLGSQPGPFYHLVELVTGDSLRVVIQRGPAVVEDALVWTDQILDALDALHAERPPIVVRDLKPENIVLSPRGAILVDLGSAVPLAEAGHAPVGTLAYSPPDLATTGWTPAGDVFSVAVVLYELLTATWPWGEAPPDSARTPTPIATLRPELPCSIAELVMRALTGPRFESAAALRTALAQTRMALAVDAARPRTLAHLPLLVEEAQSATWGAGLVQAIGRHAHPGVPLANAIRRSVVLPPETDSAALVEALVASEAKAFALEEPLPAAMPGLYDQLLRGLAPASLDIGEDDTPPGTPLAIENDSVVLAFGGLHFAEAAWLEQRLAQAGRAVHTCVYTPTEAGPFLAQVLAIEVQPLMLEPLGWPSALAAGTRALGLDLPNPKRTDVALGALLAQRRALIESALDAALGTTRHLVIVASSAVVYLGHGLRVDVGLGQRDPDGVRARWSRAFPEGRGAPDDGGGLSLPAPIRFPLRRQPGRRWVVGRLAWPDRADLPWFASGGLSLPERLLPVLLVDPA